MVLPAIDREVDEVHRPLDLVDGVHVLVAVVVVLARHLRTSRRDLELRPLAGGPAEEVESGLRVECGERSGQDQRNFPQRLSVGQEPDRILHPTEPAGVTLEPVLDRGLAHPKLAELAVGPSDPPCSVLAHPHRVPEPAVEIVERLRVLVGVDVDRPHNVAGLDPVAVEAGTVDGRGLTVEVIDERQVHPLDLLLDDEHALVGVAQIPHRAVGAVPVMLHDPERGIVRHRQGGNLRLLLGEDVPLGDNSVELLGIHNWQVDFSHIRILPDGRSGRSSATERSPPPSHADHRGRPNRRSELPRHCPR